MPLDPDRQIKPQSYGPVWSINTPPPRYPGVKEWVSKLKNHLEGSAKKSFVLIGDPGSGKTAILYSLIRELVFFEDWEVIETSSAEIMRSAVYLGEWQTRITDLMSIAPLRSGWLIYIKDIHNLYGSGTSTKSDSDMADAVIPFLERGDVVIFGECTDEAYRRGVEAVPALKSQLTTFRLAAANEEEAVKFVYFAFDDLNASFLNDIGIELSLPETTALALVQFGKIYFAGTAQPGAAISLLQATVEHLREQSGELWNSGNPYELTHRDVVAALNRISGLPLHLLDDSIPLQLKKTRDFFEARLVGQDAAITTVIDVITLIKAGLTDPGKPTAVMLFAGPTGVGKTELAKALAEFLFGAPDRMIRCDMSEYKDYHSFEKFIGRANGEEDPGSLVSQIRRQPFSVVLLDEVEKANPNIFDVLLQAFDDGRLTDANGNTTDLTQTIIVMTSNLGSDLSRPKPVGFESAGPEADELVDKALRGFFRPEFLNRIDHIVRFQPLQREHIRTLAKRELGKALMRNGLTRRELRVSVEPAVHDLLALKGYDELYGARPLRRQVEKLAVLPVARRIISLGEAERGSLLRLHLVDETITVELVEDRQTRTARRIAGGIRVEDPVAGITKKVTMSDLEDDLAALDDARTALWTRNWEEKFFQKKHDLVAVSAEETFWDDQAKARETLGEIYRLERLLGAIDTVADSHRSLTRRAEALRRDPTEAAIRQFALDLYSSLQYARLVSYAVECRSAAERRDAIIVVRLAGAGANEKDLVHELVECYRQWAVRSDYTFRIIHEEEASGAALREVAFELGGPAACGIFQAEEGEHEFVFAKRGATPASSHFLSVRVLGTTTEEAPRKVRFQKKAMKVASRFGGTVRSRITATDPDSHRSVEIASPLQGEELEEAAATLLAAEMQHAAPAESVIVRRYTMTPQSVVEDLRTPGMKVKAREFWRGEIDDLLFSGIVARRGGTDEGG